jgi:hypothetical protein
MNNRLYRDLVMQREGFRAKQQNSTSKRTPVDAIKGNFPCSSPHNSEITGITRRFIV